MNSSSTTDSTSSSLIARARARDPSAWEKLADLYGPLVYHWSRRYGLREEDCGDLMQEVFASVSAAIGDLRDDRPGSTFRGWLWTITRNKIRDFYRGRRDLVEASGGTAAQLRLAEIPDHLPDDATDDTQRSLTRSIFHRSLELVRAQFEDNTWQAFWRLTVEGHSSADIAADLGITANAVRQAKSRVLRRLREELGDWAE
jgi:RNA polymerase sigma-70 factor (ECF subfamily)